MLRLSQQLQKLRALGLKAMLPSSKLTKSKNKDEHLTNSKQG